MHPLSQETRRLVLPVPIDNAYVDAVPDVERTAFRNAWAPGGRERGGNFESVRRTGGVSIALRLRVLGTCGGLFRIAHVGVHLKLLRVEGKRLNDPAGFIQHRGRFRHGDGIFPDPR